MTAPVDPAVRSIRIAATLTERFGQVMRGPGLGSTVSDLELRIGEAQQIYPEIWSHLDEARTTLAGRGVNTTSYDTVRALEPKGSLGVTRVDVVGYSTSLTTEVLGIQDETIKTANFNIEGFRRAGMAIQALQGAMPDVDWKGLERQEASQLAMAGSLGDQKSWIKWAIVGASAFVVVYLFWYFVVRIPPRDPEEYEREASAAKAKRMAELTAKADERPCHKARVRALTEEMSWGRNAVKDVQPTRDHYKGLCDAQLEAVRAALTANPCAKDKVKELETLTSERTGRPDTSIKTFYQSACDLQGAPK